MSQVAIAAPAANLVANHSVAHILNRADVVRVERLKKAGPSCSGFEFGAGSKQWEGAQAAGISAVHFVIEQATAKWRLGAMIQQYPAFFGTQTFG